MPNIKSTWRNCDRILAELDPKNRLDNMPKPNKTYEVRINYQFQLEATNAKEALAYVTARIIVHDELRDMLTREGNSTMPTPDSWDKINLQHEMGRRW